ncbi:MAG: peptidoglycan-binding domain-containing protein [Pyrinomonadaceae bacterium]
MRTLFVAVIAALFFAFTVVAQPTATTGAATATKAAETTKKAPVFRPTKDQIKQGQAFLKDKKLYAGEATGVYNDETRASLKSYQKANALDDNGKFDKATLEKMNIALSEGQGGSSTAKAATTNSASMQTTASTQSTANTAAATSSPKKPAPFRANEEQIKAAQKILIDGKIYAGEQSGKLDDATRDGLKKYQDANKLKVTGTLNATTLEKMGIALTDGQKANVAAQTAYDANKK